MPAPTPEPAGTPAPLAVKFPCPTCGKVYKAAAADAGRRTKCKQCGAVVVIPEGTFPEPVYGVLLPPADAAEAPAPPPPAARVLGASRPPASAGGSRTP